MRCPYYDCGWCYAPDEIETSAWQGQCPGWDNCVFYTQVVEVKSPGDDSEEHF